MRFSFLLLVVVVFLFSCVSTQNLEDPNRVFDAEGDTLVKGNAVITGTAHLHAHGAGSTFYSGLTVEEQTTLDAVVVGGDSSIESAFTSGFLTVEGPSSLGGNIIAGETDSPFTISRETATEDGTSTFFFGQHSTDGAGGDLEITGGAGTNEGGNVHLDAGVGGSVFVGGTVQIGVEDSVVIFNGDVNLESLSAEVVNVNVDETLESNIYNVQRFTGDLSFAHYDTFAATTDTAVLGDGTAEFANSNETFILGNLVVNEAVVGDNFSQALFDSLTVDGSITVSQTSDLADTSVGALQVFGELTITGNAEFQGPSLTLGNQLTDTVVTFPHSDEGAAASFFGQDSLCEEGGNLIIRAGDNLNGDNQGGSVTISSSAEGDGSVSFGTNSGKVVIGNSIGEGTFISDFLVDGTVYVKEALHLGTSDASSHSWSRPEATAGDAFETKIAGQDGSFGGNVNIDPALDAVLNIGTESTSAVLISGEEYLTTVSGNLQVAGGASFAKDVAAEQTDVETSLNVLGDLSAEANSRLGGDLHATNAEFYFSRPTSVSSGYSTEISGQSALHGDGGSVGISSGNSITLEGGHGDGPDSTWGQVKIGTESGSVEFGATAVNGDLVVADDLVIQYGLNLGEGDFTIAHASKGTPGSGYDLSIIGAAVPDSVVSISGGESVNIGTTSGAVEIGSAQTHTYFTSDLAVGQNAAVQGSFAVSGSSAELHGSALYLGSADKPFVLRGAESEFSAIISGQSGASSGGDLTFLGGNAATAGQGGDVQFWAGNGGVKGGDIVVSAEGGVVNLDAGQGGNVNLGETSGFILFDSPNTHIRGKVIGPAVNFGSVQVLSDVVIDGSADISNLTVGDAGLNVGSAVLSSFVFVGEGGATFDGNLGVNNNATVEGDVDVSGNAEFSDTLYAAGSGWFAGDISVLGHTQASDSVDVKGNANVKGTFDVEGSTVVGGDFNVKDIFGVAGDASIAGKLSSKRIATGDVSTLTLTAEKTADISDAFDAGLLSVKGDSTLNEVIIDNLLFGRNGKLDSLSASSIVADELSASAASVANGSLIADEASLGSLWVASSIATGATSAGNLQSVGIEIVGDSNVEGNVQAGVGSFSGNLWVGGDVHSAGLTNIIGDASGSKVEITCATLEVNENAVFGEDADIAGDAVISGNLDAANKLTAEGSLTVIGDTEVVAGSVHAGGDAAIAGDAIFANSAYIKGDFSATNTELSELTAGAADLLDVISSGAFVSTGKVTVAGTANVLTDASFGGDTEVTGDAGFSGNLTVDGDGAIGGSKLHLGSEGSAFTIVKDPASPGTTVFTTQTTPDAAGNLFVVGGWSESGEGGDVVLQAAGNDVFIHGGASREGETGSVSISGGNVEIDGDVVAIGTSTTCTEGVVIGQSGTPTSIEGGLAVNGEVAVEGGASISGNVDLDSLTGSSITGPSLDVAGLYADNANVASIDNSVYLSANTLSVAYTTTVGTVLGGNTDTTYLTVQDTAIIGGDVDGINGALQVNGTIIVDRHALIFASAAFDTLEVVGTSSLSELHVVGSLSVGSSPEAANFWEDARFGSVESTSNIGVEGNVVVGAASTDEFGTQSLNVAGDIVASGDLTVKRDATFEGSANVNNLEVTRYANVADDLAVNGDLSIGGNANVVGGGFLGDVVVTGPTHGQDWSVQGQLNVGGNINVNGDSLVSSVNGTSANVHDTLYIGGSSTSETLTVGGNGNVGSVDTGVVDVAGSVAVINAVINGNLEIGRDITVAGDSSFDGSVSVLGRAKLYQVKSTGGVEADGAVLAELNIDGTLTTGGLAVDEAVNLGTTNIGGSLQGAGNVEVWDTTTVTGDVNVWEDTEVSNDLYANNSISVDEDLNIGDDLFVAQEGSLADTTVLGNTQLHELNVSGSFSNDGDVFVGGDLISTEGTFGSVNVEDTTTTSSTIEVTGDAEIGGSLIANVSIDVGCGGVSAGGSISTEDDVSINGNVNVGGSISSQSDVTIGGDLYAFEIESQGTATFEGPVIVEGSLLGELSSTLGDVNINGNVYASNAEIEGSTRGSQLLTYSDLDVANESNIGGSVFLQGNVATEGLTATKASTISGRVDVNSEAVVAGDASFGGLKVEGQGQLSDLSVGGWGSTIGSISVGGSASAAAVLSGFVNSDYIDVSSPASIGVLTTAGNGDLSGPVTVSGTFTVGTDVEIWEDLYVMDDTDVTGDVTVYGSTSLQELTVRSDATFFNNVAVQSSLIVQGSAAFGGDVSTVGSIYAETANFDGSSTVKGDFHVAGDYNVGTTHSVAGNSFFGKDVLANGTFTSLHEVNIGGDVGFQDSLNVNVGELDILQNLQSFGNETNIANLFWAGGDSQVDGSATVGGTFASGSLAVFDGATVTGFGNIAGDAQVSGPLSVFGNTYFGDDVQALGSISVLNNDTTFESNLVVDVDLTTTDQLAVGGSTVLHNSHFADNTDVFGNTQIADSLYVLQNADLSSTLNTENLETDYLATLNLVVSGNANIGTVTASNSDFSSDLYVYGPTTVVNGTLYSGHNIVAEHGANIAGSLTSLGDSYLQDAFFENLTIANSFKAESANIFGNVTVAEYSSIQGKLSVEGDSFVAGPVVTENIKVSTDINSAGSETVLNSARYNAGVDVSGSLSILSSANVGEHFVADGDFEVGLTLDIGKSLNVNDSVEAAITKVGGRANFGGDATVESVTTENLTSGPSTVTEVTVQGDTQILGTLDVEGPTRLGCDGAFVDTTFTGNSMSITENVVVGIDADLSGQLEVEGSTTLSDVVITGDTTFENLWTFEDFTVNSDAFFNESVSLDGSISAGAGGVAGSTVAASLSLSGSLSADAANATVGGDASFGGDFVVSGDLLQVGQSLSINHDASVAQNISTAKEIRVDGAATVEDLLVGSSATFGGSLTVDGNAFGFSLNAPDATLISGSGSFSYISTNTLHSGETNVGNALYGYGAAKFGEAEITGDIYSHTLHIQNSIEVNGNVVVERDLVVGGDATFTGEVSVNSANVGGSQNVGGNFSALVVQAGSVDVENEISTLFLDSGDIEVGVIVVGGGLNVDQASTFGCDGSLTVEGTLSASNTATFDSTLEIGGNADIEGELSVVGTANLGDVSVNGLAEVNDFGVIGSVSVGGFSEWHDLTVLNIDGQGIKVLNQTTTNTFAVEEDLFVGGDLNVRGSTDIAGELSIGGSLSVDKEVAVGGDLSIGSHLRVLATTSLADDLFVSGSVEARGSGKVSIGSDLIIGNGPFVVGGDLDVASTVETDTAIFGDLQAGSVVVASALTVQGSAEFGCDSTAVVGGDLNVEGPASFSSLTIEGGSGLSTAELEVDGDTALNGAVSVIGEASLLDDTTVTGDLTIDYATFENSLYLGNDLSVTGVVDARKDLSVSEIYDVDTYFVVTGDISIAGFATSDAVAVTKSLVVDRVVSVAGELAIAETVTIKGSSTVTGNLTTLVDFDNSGYLLVDADLVAVGDATVQGVAQSGSLVVNGQATAGSVEVFGPATLNSSLTVRRSGSFGCDAGVEISGSLEVGRGAVFGDDLTVGENVVIDRDLTVHGASTLDAIFVASEATLSGDLRDGNAVNVSGDAAFEGELFVSDYLSVGWALAIAGQTTTEDLYTYDMDVEGDVEVCGYVTVHGDTRAFSAEVEGDLYLNTGNFIADNVHGYSDLTVESDDLVVSGSADVGNNANIGDNITASSDLDIALSLTAATGSIGPLTVNEDGVIEGALTVEDGVDIAKDLYVYGETSMSGTASVVNCANVEVTGAAFIEGYVNSANSNVGGDIQVLENAYFGALVVGDGFWVGTDINVGQEASLSNTLTVTGATEVEGNVDIAGNGLFEQVLDILGNGQVASTLKVAGNAFLGEEAYVGESAEFLGNLYANNSHFLGELLVESPVNVIGELTVAGYITVDNDIEVEDNVYVGGELQVIEQATFKDDLVIEGDATVAGGAAFAGNLNITSGGLAVGGSTSFEGDVDVGDDTHIGGNVDVDANVDAGSLTVAGETSVGGDVNATAAQINELEVGGNLVIAGDFDVANDVSVGGNVGATGDVSVGSLEVALGTAVSGALSVSFDATIQGSLTVANESEITNEVTANSAILDGDTYVGEEAHLPSLLVNNNVLVSGSGLSVINNLVVTEEFIVDGVTNVGQDVDVTGNLTIADALEATGNAQAGSLVVDSSLSVDLETSVVGSVEVGGTLDINSQLTVWGDENISGNTLISGALTVEQFVTLQNSLQVLGDVSVGGQLRVQAAATANSLSALDDVVVEGNVEVGGTGAFTGPVAVDGSAVFPASVEVTGDFSVAQSVYIDGDTVVEGAAHFLDSAAFNSSNIDGWLSVDGNLEVLYGTAGFAVGEELFVGGDLSVGGTFTTEDVSTVGDVLIGGTLSVTGASIIGGNAAIDGNIVNGGALSVTGPVVVGSTFDVTGTSSLGGTLTVEGFVYINDNLAAEIDASIGGELTVFGFAALEQSLFVDDNVQVGGDVVVGGSTVTLAGLNIDGNASIAGNLNVDGVGTFENNLTVEGDLIVSGVLFADSLTVTGDATIDGNAIIEDVTIEGDLVIDSLVTDDLIVTDLSITCGPFALPYGGVDDTLYGPDNNWRRPLPTSSFSQFVVTFADVADAREYYSIALTGYTLNILEPGKTIANVIRMETVGFDNTVETYRYEVGDIILVKGSADPSKLVTIYDFEDVFSSLAPIVPGNIYNGRTLVTDSMAIFVNTLTSDEISLYMYSPRIGIGRIDASTTVIQDPPVEWTKIA